MGASRSLVAAAVVVSAALLAPVAAHAYVAMMSIQGACLGAEPFAAGQQSYAWDGLDDYGRPLPAGEYRWKLLALDGFEQRYVCDVGVSGNPPCQNDAGTGGWAGDYGFPVCVHAEDDLVVLGTGSGEAAPFANGQSQILLMDEKHPDPAKRKAAWGGMAVGAFDPKGMLRPYDIAVDRNGRVWVCEFDVMDSHLNLYRLLGVQWHNHRVVGYYGQYFLLDKETGLFVAALGPIPTRV